MLHLSPQAKLVLKETFRNYRLHVIIKEVDYVGDYEKLYKPHLGTGAGKLKGYGCKPLFC